MSKYFELNLASPDHAEERDLLGRSWHLLHAISSNKAISFSVGFPFWKDPVKTETGVMLRPGVVGPVIRVFAAESGLATIHAEVTAHRLVRSGLVSVSPIRNVPLECEQVVFVRSRTADRVTDAFIRGEEARSQRRALKGDLRGKPRNRGLLALAHAKAATNFVPLTSSVNSRRFSLNVERRKVGGEKAPNSYGLGAATPHF